MADWFSDLAALQGEIVRSLAAELRSGGHATAALAYALGALHALTPGHGKPYRQPRLMCARRVHGSYRWHTRSDRTY
jgi:hypothetical protein